MFVPRLVVAFLTVFTVLSNWCTAPLAAQPLDGTITYQGQLKQTGNPLNAVADFEFRLFDALAGGAQIGSTVPVSNVNVVEGVFTVPLNFGTASFNGDQHWLEIAVRSPAGAGSYETLTPRQPLSATPYALYALSGPAGPWAVSGNDIHNSNTGNVGIGTTTPATELHLRGAVPIMVIQDSAGAIANQAGYIGFWNSLGTETAWMGFGSPGSTLFTVRNSRGTIALLPAGGGVGIGTSTPSGDLEVRDTFGRYLRFAFGTVTINNSGTGTLMAFRFNDVQQGTITVSGSTVSYNGFMGSHYAWMDGDHSIDRGALVSMTGENRRLNDSTEGDVVYGIEPTSIANDAACLGAYLGIMEPDKATDLANPHLIAAVGNGEMLVVDSGRGGIRPGDYLISADVAGCAMKDDPQRFPIGHIVARAAQRVDWSTVVPDADGGKVVRISVFFENFVRGPITSTRTVGGDESVAIPDHQQELRAENDGLRARIEALEHLINAQLKGVDR